MVNQTKGSEPRTIGNYLTGEPQMLVLTVGFGVYPTRAGTVGDSCDGVAFPKLSLVPHRPRLMLPRACVESFEGPFAVVSNDDLMVFDITGYSASFKDVSGLSQVIDDESTRNGHFPNRVEEEQLDFNLLPDTHSFYRGLTLSPQWRGSPGLLASFTYLPGRIGGIPDHSTNKVVSHWGFTDEEIAKVRRKTNWTLHVSDTLPTTTIIELRKVGSAEVLGWIRVKPCFKNLAVALLVNGWVDQNGDYDKQTNAMMVNLSHVESMLGFCNEASTEGVTVDFGRKLGIPGNDREIAEAAQRAFAGPSVFAMFAVPLGTVGMLYNSDVNCSGRRMSMSS